MLDITITSCLSRISLPPDQARSIFSTKFKFKVYSPKTLLKRLSVIAIGRCATVSQPRYWLQSAVSQIMKLIPFNFSDKTPKIVTFKFY